jgi:hypothetical protein
MELDGPHDDAWLRLAMATALAHTVPGTELQLVMRSARRFVVSPADDRHSSCALRRLLASDGADRFAADVTEMRFTAGLSPLRANVFRADVDGRCWFATALAPLVTRAVLDELDVAAPADAVAAQIVGDTVLGVTLVGIGPGDVTVPSATLAGVAHDAATACAVEELLGCGRTPTLRHPSRRPTD